MQKISLLLVILGLSLNFSCNNSSKNNDDKDKDSTTTEYNVSAEKSEIQVMYFHATNRCVTCNAAEDNTLALLFESFKNEMETGKISFESINIDEEKNNNLTEKYQVSFSTLLIINNKIAEPVVTDFTEPAFKYALNSPDKYAELLKQEISKQLTN